MMKHCKLLVTGSILLLSCINNNLCAQSTASLNKTVVNKLAPHPRLFFSAGEEKQILQNAKRDRLLNHLIILLRKKANEKLSAAPQVYKPGVELLHTSREQVSRLITLSLASRLFNDNKYAAKVEEELINVCKFPSWHPEHFLDVAEMTTAVAIGYDWCYNYLSDATRTLVENAIRQNAFAPAWPIYEKTEKTPFNRENNWNMVCNSGMLNGAIAIGDKYPDELNRILQYAVKNTPAILESFAPEGVFNEGPGYWGYNGIYMSLFFDNLNRNIHNTYGLPNFKGIYYTAHFYSSLIGPSQMSFNYGDAATLENIDYNNTLFFLSKQYNQPGIAAFYRKLLQSAVNDPAAKDITTYWFFFMCIPWYNDAVEPKPDKEDRLTVFNGVTDFLFFNGDKRGDKNRLWLAAKTGRPNWSHSQMDVGSFVVDADGERWGIDLGPDNYSLPNFWDYKPGGVRWNYFRNTNLAHNTITIDNKIANSAGQGELLHYNKKGVKPFGIFDMSTSYAGEATSALRGFKLLSADAVLIRDEITLKPGSKKVAWRFLTNAEVKIRGNTAVLSQHNKNFYIRCLLPGGYRITSFPAHTNSADEKPIDNVTIIEIAVDAVSNSVAIPVVLTKNSKNLKASLAGNTELDSWK